MISTLGRQRHGHARYLWEQVNPKAKDSTTKIQSDKTTQMDIRQSLDANGFFQNSPISERTMYYRELSLDDVCETFTTGTLQGIHFQSLSFPRKAVVKILDIYKLYAKNMRKWRILSMNKHGQLPQKCCFAFIAVVVLNMTGLGLAEAKSPCTLLKSEEVAEVVGRSFQQPEERSLLGSITCAWVAHETIANNSETGTQRNVTQVVMSFYEEPDSASAKSYFEHMRVGPGYLTDEPGTPIGKFGHEAFEKEGLFILYENLVFSIRYAPYTRAPRTNANLEVEIPIAQKILARLSDG